MARENYYEGQFLELWIEEGILCGVYKVKTVDLQTAQEATLERLNYVENKSYQLSLVDYRMVRETNKGAREYFSSQVPSTDIKAMAIIIDSLIGKAIYNFYFRFNTPPYPMQVFNDFNQGKRWLKQFNR